MPPLAMGRRSWVGGGEDGSGRMRRISRHAPVCRRGAPRHAVRWMFAALLVLQLWVGQTWAMRADRISRLRHETVEMFYHGFDNYMKVAFPEDEVCSVYFVFYPIIPSPSDN